MHIDTPSHLNFQAFQDDEYNIK